MPDSPSDVSSSDATVETVSVEQRCLCGERDCMHFAFDYPWCRPCGEHHRPPECAIDEQGRSLMSCGCAWSVVEAAGYGEEAHYAPGCYIVEERNHA